MDYYKNTTDYESLDTEEILTSSFAPYPNPASGLVYFSGLKKETEIKIYNLFEKFILKNNSWDNEWMRLKVNGNEVFSR